MKQINKIDSLQNEYIKKLSKLKTRPNIIKEGLFLIEGKNIIYEANKNQLINKILISDKNLYKDLNVEKILVSEKIINKLSSNKTNEGAIAVCDLKEKQPNFKKYKNIILLDSINNPKNLGAIIRNAKALNFDAIVLFNDSTFIYNDKTIRSSQGAVFDFDVFEIDNLETLEGFDFYHFVLETGAIPLSNTKYSEKNCLVFGNEANGISENVVNSLKGKKVFIEISKFESLNVAVATGIAMYNLMIRRNNGK